MASTGTAADSKTLTETEAHDQSSLLRSVAQLLQISVEVLPGELTIKAEVSSLLECVASNEPFVTLYSTSGSESNMVNIELHYGATIK